ncbi:uncharacterized protein LOC118277789 isoform X2 [Spodoptera frugiperda]|uniref:Uncharacterized protein LOC118277789 isoform X2 n=1 Tax=Spodoptera frugiperda TaxID=7108 RepID=A0A9R0E0A8_SPOFR|nr:uncharacterized protein LOC118277789 isoform X2 [Spodoptera frugiperda]
MDEKESLPDKPSEDVTQDSGDTAAATEAAVEDNAASGSGDAGAEASADATDSSTDVKTDSDITKSATDDGDGESELQNHVDNDAATEDSSSVKSDIGDSKTVTDTTDADSQDTKDEDLADKVIEESQDSELTADVDEKVKDELPQESTSQDEPSQESTSQDNSETNSQVNPEPTETSQESIEAATEDITIKQDEEAEKNESSVVEGSCETEAVEKEEKCEETKEDVLDNDDKKDNDEVGKPEFETAPNVTLDESQEDHTQALDPFDALLKDTTDSSQANETREKSDIAVTVNIDDDDDDHNADDHHGDVHEDDEDHHTDHPDEGGVSELADEPGADEEVCLLPDIEREISDADKAEAEKALAEKRKQAEEAAAEAAAIAAVPKEETVVDAEGSRDDHLNSEAVEEHAEADAANDEASHENGGEKENENEHDESAEIDDSEIPHIIQEISPFDSTCTQCKTEQACTYRYTTKDNETAYLCSEACVKDFQSEHAGQYSITHKKYLIQEIASKLLTCSECEEKKMCYFYYNYDGEDTNYCSMACLNSMMADEADKYVFKRRRIVAEEIEPKEAECYVCKVHKSCIFSLNRYGEHLLVCENACIKTLNGKEDGRYMIRKKRILRRQPTQPQNPPLLKLKVISNATDKYLDEAYKIQAKTPAMVQAAREERERTFIRKCNQCQIILNIDEKLLTWETMDFCGELCLGRYQNKIGARCANCKNNVQHTSLGKYCVRFGFDIRQFCNWSCLEEFKKGLKICCYCQRDISVGHQGFLAPVGDKGQFKDFCSQACMEKFDLMSKNPIPQPVWAKCAVCSLEKATSIEVEVSEELSQRLCSDPCFAAFKFVNNIFPDQCRWCKKYFERKQSKCFTIYESSNTHCFCSKSCMNVYISNSRHIVPCNWCKVKKYNFDMIRRVQTNGQAIMMCSLNCLNLYQVSMNAVSPRRTQCDMCKITSQVQYHLTMSDASLRNFCSYKCVETFQGRFSNPVPPDPLDEAIDQEEAVPSGTPRRTYSAANKSLQGQRMAGDMPVISNVQSLAAQQPVPEPEPPVSPEIPLPPKSPSPSPPPTPPSAKSPTPPPTPPSTKIPIAIPPVPSTRAPTAIQQPPSTRTPTAKQPPPSTSAPIAIRPSTKTFTAIPSPPSTKTFTAIPSPPSTKTLTAIPPSTKTFTAKPRRPSTKTLTTISSPPSTKTLTAILSPPSTKTLTAIRPSTKTFTAKLPRPSTKTLTAISPPPSTKTLTAISPPPSTKTLTAISPPPSTKTLTAISPPPSTKTLTAIPPPPSTKTLTAIPPPPSTKTLNKTPVQKPRSHKMQLVKLIPASKTKPTMVSKGVSCGPEMCTKECQTDPSLERRVLIPVPVPIYVPVPCAMWSLPFPVPVPIPLPIPTPVFIPTTRNSAKGIMKEIDNILDNKPTNPFEEELLMMAEMVASGTKKEQSDSDSDVENEENFNPVTGIDTNNALGEDLLQMAFKMATEYEEKPLDLESAMVTNTITPALRAPRKRASALPGAAHPAHTSKKRRADPPPAPLPAPLPDPPREPAEKPDDNMCLKYTFGVNAWKQWVMTKNAEIEKSSIRRKPFKSEILQLTADELNYSLCLFVKEVRKPNGSEYAPDTIYYLVLGIQQYLFENGRIDNIFTDPYYEKFTDCLDEIAKQFSTLYGVTQYIVTRVEEEHLWESKQLGVHTPHVLLSTLMFFNTKYFHLMTVEDHLQLSLAYILRHRKLKREDGKGPGSNNDILRYYPPQFDFEPNTKKKKKKVYEQYPNEENPFRCPLKLFEFYISKCPESVRTRNDVLYLQPERSCVPDSPVWYSTQPLSREALAKMLHRVKMVKEINIALLTS